MPKNDDTFDDVGYGRPPKATRFTKGNNFGQRKRRRRRSHRSAFDSFEVVLNHRIRLTINGEPHHITIGEAMLLKLRELALSGNRRAIAKVQKLQNALPPSPEDHAAEMEKWERARLSVRLKFQRYVERMKAEDAAAKKEAGGEGS
ncbi:MAG: hypothetical protein KF810_13535 [Rhizobiaceae bacterium]|nr:hypothetical protein [Rhizobiaceae bacterium]